jgi:BirA family biotin operon repressor/biotin-[acetyl-CoA-carboxylase] ligase
MKQEILRDLPAEHPWRDLIQVHDVLDSSNTYAKELARQGAPEGTVVIARSQLDGRGRLGRRFHSPADAGLYFSLILRPDCTAERLMHLTCAVAVAACDAVEQVSGLRPGIKWINDLTVNGKKLGGILTELSFDAHGKVGFAVVGIGINCQQQELPQDIAHIACSLADHCKEASPGRLAARLMVALESVNRRLLTDQAQLMNRYRADCVTLGKQVRVLSPNETEIALAQSVNDDGSLTVILENGEAKTVNSGEVSVRGLWDYT